MSDTTAFGLAQRTHSMPLLAHLEELRRRIICSVVAVLAGFLSCWSFADRIFGLMQQPIIQALRHHGLGGGLVYLNPTEPFNLYLDVTFVAGHLQPLHLCSINCGGLSLRVCIARKRYALPFLLSTVGLFIAGGLFGYKMVYPSVPGLLNRLRPTLPADDYDWRIYEAVCNRHHRSWVDFRNANSRVLSGFDEGDYGSLDVAESAVLHTRHLYYRGNRHTHGRHLKHVPFRCSDGCALRHQHGSGLAGQFQARARSRLHLALRCDLSLQSSHSKSKGQPTGGGGKCQQIVRQENISLNWGIRVD